MAAPEIRLVGPEYDGAELELGSFASRVANIMHHMTAEQYGKDAAVDPTDIEIAPIVIQEDEIFVIRAWHETAADKGKTGVLQPTIGSFEIRIDETDAYLQHTAEGGWSYKLTTVEALTLSGLGKLAAAHDAIHASISSDAADI